MRFKIKRIGSFGDSKTDFIVRLCKADREHLGIQDRALVKVKKGRQKVIALVKQQFVDLAGYPEVCSVNQLLTQKLDLNVDNSINITADVTQEEADQYTSQDEFENRQVSGVLLRKKEPKRVKDVMQRLGLFADAQNPEQSASENIPDEGENDNP